jgi:hypothetical protein
MNTPFQVTMNTPMYALTRTWGQQHIDIVKDINDTFFKYGEDGVYDKDFNKLITRLSQNSKQGKSILNWKRDPAIILALCDRFSAYFNTKNIDQLISCFTKETYPMNCIESIMNTGYKFTDSQVAVLNTLGYPMYSLTKILAYNDFLSLLSTSEFANTLNNGLEHVLSTQDIECKVKMIRDICDKYKIKLQSDFVGAWIKSLRFLSKHDLYSSLDTLINIHHIAKKFNIEYVNETIIDIIDNNSIFFEEKNKVNYSFKNLKNTYCAEFDYAKFKVLSNFYNTFTINRSIIIDRLSLPIITALLHPLITNYNPINDIFYILTLVPLYHNNKLVTHLLNHNYLKYDQFLMYLLSIGLIDDNDIINECITKYNISINEQYIENFYTFAQYDILNLLCEHKIMPILQNILLCTSHDQLTGFYDNSIFIDDDIEKYICSIIGHTDPYDYNIFKEAINNNAHINIDYFLNIYDSLSERDKNIFERVDIDSIFKLSTIIKYRLNITDEYLINMIARGHWKSLILLLHISSEYDYLIDMMDINIIILAPSLIARKWLVNNILNSNICSFAMPNEHYTLQVNVQKDVDELMKMSIVNNIAKFRTDIITNRNDTKRRAIMSNICHTNLKISQTSWCGPEPLPNHDVISDVDVDYTDDDL